MPVGTGSINRAARSGKKTTNTTTNTTVETAVKSEGVVKQAPAKTVSTKKSAPAKKVTRQSNECCQLTQELPIHLL